MRFQMSQKRKNEIIYRYYEMPLNSPVLALYERPYDRTENDRLHFHNYMEIGYCCEGSCSVILDNHEFPCHGGMLTIIPQNVPHMTIFHKELKCRWQYLIIDTDTFLSDIYKDNCRLAAQLIRRINYQAYLDHEKELERIAVPINQIFKLMQEQEELYLEELKGLLLTLLINIAKRNKEAPLEDYPPKAPNTTIIAPALDYISRVPERPIKIEELAAMCHVSEAHFRRIFVESMNMPPLKYINQVRIRRACDELQRTHDSINAIATRTGFSTLSTFNRNFRQITGTSPQQLRKQSGQRK